MSKTLSKSLDIKIDRKTILTIYIFIQMLLHLLAFKTLNNHGYNVIEYVSIFLALIYSFVVYLVILLNNKNKGTISYYCISTVLLSFFLIIDLNYLRRNQIHNNYVYIQIMILFVMLDITLKILTQNINKGSFYKYIVITLWTLGVVFGISRSDVYMLVYQITFLIINIYPIIFLIFNYKKIRNYGKHLIPTLLLLSIINIIFLSWSIIFNVPNSGSYNYDLYIFLHLIEVFLSYLVLSALGFWKLIKGKKIGIKRNLVIGCVFIIGYLYLRREQITLGILSIISLALILKQCQLLDHYIKLTGSKDNYIGDDITKDNLFKHVLENNILDFKKEELYKERVADFLHDEILQDVIYIKRELRDNYKISVDDKVFKIADKMINNTRGQISLYKPYINYEISLADNYYDLIKSLKNRFGMDNILVDFVCDDKLFLSSPYDLVIYRMIHELVTNIFKHSKGEYSVIELEVKNDTIVLNVTNHEDYLENGYMTNTDSRGLKIIKRETDRFGGTLQISSFMDSDILINKDTLDNSIVNIKIEIPIKGEITYEHFINR
ncbi:hypothetical protein RBU61_05155 [Tissierella sp. MB52-C2]|uniref:sensor histidine kinase n=1 Tax=Tissierella sp. MB52-C2 TaxID=3070999 RepID=UPI00280A9EE4|nr:hypothetical protein [Tissierella sp. MB52-C2]WMM26065.1 hypothetical protein RBU61_05155 [Tissierella sp. MB52-C2]